MASFNKTILIGNITADPELKQTQSGLSVCSFNIAVNRRVANNGEQKTDFFTIQAWRSTAEFVSRYFKKGSPILVCGQLQTREYTDSQGNARKAVEIVADEVTFVGSKETPTEREKKPVAGQQTYMPPTYIQPTANAPQFEALADEQNLPF